MIDPKNFPYINKMIKSYFKKKKVKKYGFAIIKYSSRYSLYYYIANRRNIDLDYSDFCFYLKECLKNYFEINIELSLSANWSADSIDFFIDGYRDLDGYKSYTDHGIKHQEGEVMCFTHKRIGKKISFQIGA